MSVVALVSNGALELQTWNGCYSAQEANNKFRVRARVGFQTLQHPWEYSTREAADRVARGINATIAETGVIGCEDWQNVCWTADRMILEKVYKEGRERRLPPAKALRNARWAVKAYQEGNW